MIDTFSMLLPAPASFAEEALARVLPETPEYEEIGAGRILIVDDEQGIRNAFAEFPREQYQCETAGSANEALARLAEDKYALVISDVMMPGPQWRRTLARDHFALPRHRSHHGLWRRSVAAS